MSALQLFEAVCIYAYKLRKIFESFPTKLYVYHWTNIAPFCTLLPTTHTFNLTRKKYECTNNCISGILTAKMCVCGCGWSSACMCEFRSPECLNLNNLTLIMYGNKTFYQYCIFIDMVGFIL